MSIPRQRTVPREGESSPTSMRTVVVFPDPFGPSSPDDLPRRGRQADASHRRHCVVTLQDVEDFEHALSRRKEIGDRRKSALYLLRLSSCLLI